MASPLHRSELLDDRSLTGKAFCDAYGRVVEAWLRALWDDAVASAPGGGAGMALVAIGGQGRDELCPQSDLDLLLLTARGVDASAVADGLWYPIWDEGLKLGHSVRSVRDTLALAADDLETATSLLSARHLAGDADLTGELAEKARLNWQRKGRRWLEVLSKAVEQRHLAHGEVAFDLEPDLKEGRGGLRDVHALGWARAAGADIDERVLAELRGHHDDLLAVRVELHRASGRPGDTLTLADQDEIAPRLGDVDADALMSRVAVDGGAIAWTSDESWHEIRTNLEASRFGRFRRDRPIEGDLVLRDGRIALPDETAPVYDASAVLRVAVAAARVPTRISIPTLQALQAAPDLGDPWPDEARELFVQLLESGSAAIPVVEALDRWGLWVRLVPEWEPTRSRIQRNVLHRFTVDRHLLEAASEASRLGARTRRDLLEMAALLHDIGKGYPGDHSEVGEELATTICSRMGFDPADVAMVAHAVRHHLLLPDVATRRDLDDPATIELVARTVQTPERLALLRAVSEADGLATGPLAWSEWKAQLVDQLANRTSKLLNGDRVDEVVSDPFPTEAQRELLGKGGVQIQAEDDAITVVCPDRPGVFHRVAGVLALHGLDVISAAIHSEDGMALDEFRVDAGPSGIIQWDRVGEDVVKVLEGRLAIQARLDERIRTHRGRRRPGIHQLGHAVRFDNDASADATVLEIVGADSIGLLYRLTRALTDLDVDVRTAKIHTMGADVVDAFYVVSSGGAKIVDEAHQDEIRRALLHALEPIA
ncbi:[protein-PII] uridylyltransferase [Dermatobacter hominis]|uniref:[protein-PII] uridylyltransferase n=1 Tax=Dermatobacter hominis TaxID=2884263 RepID=UPI001D0F69B4|nr:[protein-PII] uridylyltransferase [Dermatobacter hominis]UDY34600.1 [protein-PII] uridylyltransferase [Dermatobacter hominis]